MDAIVLVGGRGTRLRPLTHTTPKPMLPIGNVAMVEHIVRSVAGAGVERVVLSLGFRPDAFSEAYPDGTIAGLPVVYAVEPEPRDTGGAIAYASDAAACRGDVLVLNGDVMAHRDLDGLLTLHRTRAAEATIALTKVEDPSAFGVVPTTDDGRVLGFIEKPARHEAPTNWINAGTYVMAGAAVAAIPRHRRVSVERETFPAMVERGCLFAHKDPGSWLDTGTPAQFLQANLDLVDENGGPIVAPSAEIAPSANVTRSVIGPECRVADGATVHDAVVMRGAAIEAEASVVRSLVGPAVVVGAGAVVADSVLGAGAAVASGESVSDARRPQPEENAP